LTLSLILGLLLFLFITCRWRLHLLLLRLLNHFELFSVKYDLLATLLRFQCLLSWFTFLYAPRRPGTPIQGIFNAVLILIEEFIMSIDYGWELHVFLDGLIQLTLDFLHIIRLCRRQSIRVEACNISIKVLPLVIEDEFVGR